MGKIDEIIGKLTIKEITLEQAKQQVSDLFDVSNCSDLEKILIDSSLKMLETIDLLASKNSC
jgi:hypothetical protein